MNYQKKYKFSIVNYNGGKIPDEDKILFSHKDELMNNPLTWDYNNKIFLRDQKILSILKLSRDVIKKIIVDETDYNILLNCVELSISPEQLNKLKEFPDKYESIFKSDVKQAIVSNLINYFKLTYAEINSKVSIRKNIDPTQKKLYESHFSLFKELYQSWENVLKVFYGNNDLSKSAPSEDSLYQRLYKNPIKDNLIKETNKLIENDVVTYLKVRCDTHKEKKYNQHYNVYLEDLAGQNRPQSLYLTGPDPNTNAYFYDFETNVNNPNIPNVEELQNGKFVNEYNYPNNSFKYLNLDVKKQNVESINRYDFGYLYGPFTKIFTPADDNKKISVECTDILDNLNKNNSVFVLGYGASGAGKTSTLIALKTKDRTYDGILLELLKNIDVNEVIITVSELYSEVLGKTEKNEYKGIKFVKKQNKNEVEYVIANNQVLEGEFKEKTRNTIIDPKNKQEKSILFDDLKYKWRIENGSFKLDHPKLNTYMEINKISKEAGITKLSDFILTVVDTVRKVSPTTNNPASSRSHLLIYIEIPSTDNTDSKYLIFGDLAGVENKFTCEDTNTQIRFFEIKNEDRDPSLKDTEEGNESYYTTSNTLKYTPITPEKGDNLSEFNDILKYFGYDPVIKSIKDRKTYDNNKKYYNFIFNNNNQNILPNDIGNLNYSDLPISIINKYHPKKEGEINKDNFQVLDAKINEVFTNSNVFIDLIKNIKVSDDKLKSTIKDRYKNNPNNKYIEILNIMTNSNLSQVTTTSDFISKVKNQADFIKGYLEYLQKTKNVKISANIQDELRKNINNSGFIDPKFFDLLKVELISIYPILATVNTTLANRLIKSIDGNLSVLDKSGVKEKCNERYNEGVFINDALSGMSQRISSLITDIRRNKSDTGILKNIPLIKESCMKFFCNHEHDACFKTYSSVSNNYNDAILGDIEERISRQKLSGLKVVVFGVLNLNRNANNPPKIPYIDITDLKTLQKEYETYKSYNVEINDSIKNKFRQQIKTLFVGKGNEDIEITTSLKPSYNSILFLLNKFKDNLGQASDIPLQKYKEFIKPEADFELYLKEFIESLYNINSLSVIGTIDFLNSVKNVFTTDIPCNLLKDLNDPLDVADNEDDVTSYRNIVTQKTFSDDLTLQKKNLRDIEKTSKVSKVSNVPTETLEQDDPEASKVSAEPASIEIESGISNLLGGFLSRMRKLQKYL